MRIFVDPLPPLKVAYSFIKYSFNALYFFMVSALGLYLYFRGDIETALQLQGDLKTTMHELHEWCYYKAVDKLGSDVLENPAVAETTAGQLVSFVEIPRIKRLMADLMVQMLYDEGFEKNTFQLTHKIIYEYLESQHGVDKLTELVQTQVMRNPEVRQNIFELLEDYLLNKDKANLLNKAEDVLQSILQMEGIRTYVKDNLHEQFQATTENQSIFEMAVENAESYLKNN